MPTELLYFDDTYLFAGAATVLGVTCSSETTDDPDLAKALSKAQHAVILDQTLFYPQGGGQPTDVGTISSNNAVFSVKHVFSYNSVVYHLGEFSEGEFSTGDSVVLSVDEAVRRQNAKCHSGGHTIFSLIKDSQWPMVEKKGHHFTDGAYVEFTGIMPDEIDKDKFQAMVDKVISDNVEVTAYTKEDGLRYVKVGDFVENPCGGTHIKSTGELGKLVIRKIARRKGQNLTKISYTV
ncbi:hypothetical protein DL89DRAFT_269410 [Linderina pennispora]|uniref:Alanyl-transfer RNA synthetases family profile domain-containing protein n=1 Tax=Linderina pennispora TaxID=61395 RepID=A0A1Y1W290_9FUNG|nr:uncharacterized protein DL89DRAFT_269410 [Linderina pennispora]ORX67639.1 hypothetical protein DL89DRAFT_269410 [Linderina pennispora]